MARYKRGTKLGRADLWAKAGGIDAVANELRKADVLNRNTDCSSEIWSELSMALFGEDAQKNRRWLWVVWAENRKGVRERIHQETKESDVLSQENRTEEIEPKDQSMEVPDVNTQNDTEIVENERDSMDVEPNNSADVEQELLNSTPETMTAQETEPGHSEWRQCPKVRKTFHITLERKKWNKIEPLIGSSRLRQPWTDIMYNSFKEKNPCCTLTFRYQHVKPPQSRKKNSPYLRVLATCTFPSCTAKYSFKMQNQPAALDKRVKISVQQMGEIHHKLSDKKCRPATLLKRGKIAKALTKGPCEYFYTKLQSAPKEQLLAGNMTECLSKNVLKVIGYELRKKERLHPDILKEIHLMQTIIKECDTKYFKIPGYIQHFSVDPFMVHMYSELGMSILVHHLGSRSPVSLYLDATGGVVSKIPDQPKCVLYYALVLPGHNRIAPSLPVCELLSNDHSIPPITFWLMQFALHLTQYTQLSIYKVETDYSWALIQSVMLAFNKEHIISYLNRAYECCTGKKPWDEDRPYTIVHLCATHILKAVRRAIMKQTDDEGLKDFVLFAFARLQNATTLAESRTVFRPLCTLLTTQRNTDSVKQSLNSLESIILRFKEEEEEELPSVDWQRREREDRRRAMTITGSSPFYAFFQQILNEVKEQAAGEMCTEAEDNPYFCPGILNLLFDTYLAIYPLWSGLLLGDLRRHMSHEQGMVATTSPQKTRDSNSHIENWFRTVKYTIMHGKKKVRPGTFIRAMYRSMQARYTEHIIQQNLPQELLLKPLLPDLEQSKETWMKKNKEFFPKSSSKPKFFSVPQDIPVPDRKTNKTKRKKRS